MKKKATPSLTYLKHEERLKARAEKYGEAPKAPVRKLKVEEIVEEKEPNSWLDKVFKR